MPYPQVCWSGDKRVWAECCRDGTISLGSMHARECPYVDPNFPAHLKRLIPVWREVVTREDYAKSTKEVLDRAFLSTPLKGSDLPQEVVTGFFIQHGVPTDIGVALLTQYNQRLRGLETRHLEANADSLARLANRPDLKADFLRLLMTPVKGSL